jgi:hypothetical protein
VILVGEQRSVSGADCVAIEDMGLVIKGSVRWSISIVPVEKVLADGLETVKMIVMTRVDCWVELEDSG